MFQTLIIEKLKIDSKFKIKNLKLFIIYLWKENNVIFVNRKWIK